MNLLSVFIQYQFKNSMFYGKIYEIDPQMTISQISANVLYPILMNLKITVSFRDDNPEAKH